MSIESVMPSNDLILCHPLLLLPSILPSIRIFSNESVLQIRWPKYWSFGFSISPSVALITLLYIHQWPFLIAQLVKNPPAMQETPIRFLVWEDPLEKGWLPNPVFLRFPCGSAGKESTCNVGDLGLITGLGRTPGEGKGYPLQYSSLENSMDCIVHGVTKSGHHWLSHE